MHPQLCLLVHVIDLVKTIIVLGDHRYDETFAPLTDTVYYDQRYRRMRDTILGKYQVDDTLLNQLKERWHLPHCQIVCATDGGLKDKVGTSSYAFFSG